MALDKVSRSVGVKSVPKLDNKSAIASVASFTSTVWNHSRVESRSVRNDLRLSVLPVHAF